MDDHLRLSAVFFRGLAYKGLAENVTTQDEEASDTRTREQGSTLSVDGPCERAKALLTLAFKDVGAAHMLDKADDRVAGTLSQVKESMDAVGLDWTQIELDIPPRQMPAATGAGGWGHGVGSMTAGHTENSALIKAISQNASTLRNGASVLGRLDSNLVLDLVRSKQGNGK